MSGAQSVCAVPGEGSVAPRDMSYFSLGLFSLPVLFLTEFKAEKQMGFMISAVLLKSFSPGLPSSSALTLYSPKADPLFLVVIVSCNQSLFTSVTT